MKGHTLFVVCGCLLLAACASAAERRVPDGTYVAVTDRTAVLVFDGDEAIVQMSATLDQGPASWIGRGYSYNLSKSGDLHFIGTSAEAHYLIEQNRYRHCRWNDPLVECQGNNGDDVTYMRPPAGVAMPPATEEQRVWLAAAQHVHATESAGMSTPAPLAINSRTTFPGRAAVSRLQKNAKQEFCGESREDARTIIYVLNRLGGRARSVRDVFANRPEFALADSRPTKGDYLGLSEVLFYKGTNDRQFAYLNVDIGGQSGSIVKMEKQDGAWAWSAECATWTNY